MARFSDLEKGGKADALATADFNLYSNNFSSLMFEMSLGL